MSKDNVLKNVHRHSCARASSRAVVRGAARLSIITCKTEGHTPASEAGSVDGCSKNHKMAGCRHRRATPLHRSATAAAAAKAAEAALATSDTCMPAYVSVCVCACALVRLYIRVYLDAHARVGDYARVYQISICANTCDCMCYFCKWKKCLCVFVRVLMYM